MDNEYKRDRNRTVLDLMSTDELRHEIHARMFGEKQDEIDEKNELIARYEEILGYSLKDDWQKQAHIEGVLAEKETLGAILKQCQEANGKLKAEIDELELIKKQNAFELDGQDREISQLLDALEMVLNNAKKFKKQEGLQLYTTVFSDVGFMELKALLAPYKGE